MKLVHIIIIPTELSVAKRIIASVIPYTRAPLIFIVIGKCGTSFLAKVIPWECNRVIGIFESHDSWLTSLRQCLPDLDAKYVGIFHGPVILDDTWETSVVAAMESKGVDGAIPLSVSGKSPEYGCGVVVWKKSNLLLDGGTGSYVYGLHNHKITTTAVSGFSYPKTFSGKHYSTWMELKNIRARVPPYAEWGEASLDVIIPVYQNISETLRAIKTASEFSDGIVEGYIVNDGPISDDDILQQTAKEVGFTFLRNSRNRGFPGTCNTGWTMGKSKYVCFLNSDTILGPHWASLMLGHLMCDSRCGMIGPSSSRCSSPQQVTKYHKLRHSMDTLAVNSAAIAMYNKHGTACEILDVTGFCFITRRFLLEAYEGFDESYGYGYGEEDQFRLQMAMDGYSSIWLKGVYVHHIGGSSFRKISGYSFHGHRAINYARLRKFKHSLGRNGERPVVDIMVLSYNRWEYTSRTLSSIIDNTKWPYRIVVTDNHSTDESRERLSELLLNGIIDEVYFEEKNRGNSDGKNREMRRASTIYFAMIDNDMRMHEGWLTKCMENLLMFRSQGLVLVSPWRPEKYVQRFTVGELRHPGDFHVTLTSKLPGGTWVGQRRLLTKLGSFSVPKDGRLMGHFAFKFARKIVNKGAKIGCLNESLAFSMDGKGSPERIDSNYMDKYRKWNYLQKERGKCLPDFSKWMKK